MRTKTTGIIALIAGLAMGAPVAQAFCGFYVAGADEELVNDATMVVMMREGSRTVLSMQNHYEGPPENFAMVIPVPVVLEEEHVKVLKPEVFERIDHLAAPRLVEYWEVDPCYVEPPMEEPEMALPSAPMPRTAAREEAADLGVTIEAEFAVGEYEIVTVMHLAAQTTVGVANRNPVSTLDTNIRGTWALLEACRRSSTVQQIVLASSDKAYGDQEALPP